MRREANTTDPTKASDTSHVRNSPCALYPEIKLINVGLSKSPTVASFVRPTRPAEVGQSFLAALEEKYVGKEDEPAGPQILISGSKVAEEMGFDKVRRQMAQLNELKVAILDGSRIDTAWATDDPQIHDTCPMINNLDLSRNLFQTIGPVITICSKLPALRKLAIK